MSSASIKTKRIPALDTLRGSLMLLGIVLHAAMPFAVLEHDASISFRDPERMSIVFDFIIAIIHSFRMQLFFVVGGFFASILLFERGIHSMLINRLRRLGGPLALSLLILWPLTFIALFYAQSTAAGASVKEILSLVPHLPFFPIQLAHLWFLYTLFLLSMMFAAAAVLLRALSHHVHFKFPKIPSWTVSSAVLVLGVLSLLIHERIGTIAVLPVSTLTIEIEPLAYYGIFFLFGCIVYFVRSFFMVMKRHAFLYLVLGLAALVVHQMRIESIPYLNAAAATLAAWFLLFAVAGLYLRYLPRASTLTRYCSDAAYWVYLIHLPIVFFFIGFLWPLPIGAAGIYVLTILLTTIVCFVSYHYLVRDTIIGATLNGRRYPRKLMGGGV